MIRLYSGWPISEEWRRAASSGQARKWPKWLGLRERIMYQRAEAWGKLVYVALTPCGSLAKVGVSWRPHIRVRQGQDVAEFCHSALVEVPEIARIYPGGRELEAEAHRFLERDRVRGEWYRPGPRLNALIRRLDERYREDLLDMRFGQHAEPGGSARSFANSVSRRQSKTARCATAGGR